MPPATTRYFKDSVDQNWDTLGNWWSDVAFTEGFSGTLTGVTVTDTDETVTCDSTAGLAVGRPITGTGIDTGSTVASITNGTDFELSLPAIANGSSNLTCELHVIPVTGDDVVIATGNGTVAGTPSADVLGLVTVNGDSNLNVTLAAANFEFNDTSYIDGDITGNCTFNDYSYNICGDGNTGGITGDCTFNDNSFNGLSNVSGGYITGDCWFYNSSFNEYNGDITGNATFPESEYSTALQGPQGWSPGSGPQLGSVSGTVTFSSLTPVKFTLASTESWTSNTSGWVFDTAGQNWEFNDTSFNDTTGNITGDCTFNDSSYNDGDVYGNCVFNDNSRNSDNSGSNGTVTGDFQWGSSDYNYGTITGDCVGGAVLNEYPGVIHGNCTVGTGGTVAQNASIINGDCDFLSGRYQYGSSGEINGNVTFSGNRVSGYGGMTGGVINGDVTFSDDTIHDGNGTINGAVTFNDTSRSQSTINGPVTFNDSSIHDTSNYTITGDCTFNGYAYTYNATAGITGNCTFNDNSYAYSTVITGNCTFNDSSYVHTGTITGNATFTNTAFSTATTVLFNPQLGTVSGTVDFPNGATFTLETVESWTVDTSAWTGTLAWVFNGTSSNGGTLNGNATVRQHAAAFTTWRDYATSTYITGTLTLQFPEMDILGTGLL